MMASMTMLKRSDMWITDFGASNHVTFSNKGCQNKRNATGLTHRIVGKSVPSVSWIYPVSMLTKMEIKWEK
jgi:hypothetical protein